MLAAFGAVLLSGCSDRAETYYEEARRYEAGYEFDKAARRYELIAVGFKRSPQAEDAAAGLARCRAELSFDAAEELIYAGAAYTAIPRIAAARRLDPENPRGLYLTGLAHRYIGPEEVALDQFDEMIKDYPESPYGYLGRAEYFRNALRRDEALADYVRAFRIAGRDVRNRGAAFRGIRDMTLKLERPEEEANRYLREIRGTNPPEAVDYWTGYFYIKKKPRDFRAGWRYFDKVIAVEDSPYRARAFIGRAECRLRFKDYEAAKADADTAIALDPDNDYFYKVAERAYRGLSLPPPEKAPK
jgi:tetratricopeptide (TPR) repeat protein